MSRLAATTMMWIVVDADADARQLYRDCAFCCLLQPMLLTMYVMSASELFIKRIRAELFYSLVNSLTRLLYLLML